jgi:hypothetical protein
MPAGDIFKRVPVLTYYLDFVNFQLIKKKHYSVTRNVFIFESGLARYLILTA